MKYIIKDITIKILLLITFVGLAVFLGMSGNADMRKADAASPTPAIFEMCDGVEVKLTSEGMRFKVRMDEATANEIIENDNVSLKFLIAPSSFFDAVTKNIKGIKDYYNDLSKKIVITVNENLIYENEGYYYANGCVVDILSANREIEYKCIAVKQTVTPSETINVYATEGDNVRCLYNLLKKAVFDDESEEINRVFYRYSWYGSDQYPITIDNSDDFESFMSVTSKDTNYDLYKGKYYAVELSVRESSAYTSAIGGGGSIEDFEADNTVISSYPVRFNDYDGTLLRNSYIRENTVPVYTGRTPTRKGHTFAGWYVGDVPVTDDYKVTGSLTITAGYSANNYVLTFSGCSEKTVTYGEAIGELPTAGWLSGVSEWKIGTRLLNSETVYDYDGNVTAQAGTVYIANGTTNYKVVYPELATTAEKEAAAMLVKHIKAISGITLPIMAENEITYNAETSKVISVGNTNIASGVSTSSLTHDGYIIKTIGKTIVLKGENDNGIKYAVSGYLEELGVKFTSINYTSYPTENYIICGNYNVATSPDIANRSYSGGRGVYEPVELKMGESIAWCDAYSAGYTDVHNTLSYVQPSVYYTSENKNSNYHMFKRSSEYNKPSEVVDICWTDGINSSGEWDGTTSAFSIALESLKNFVRNSSPECKYFMFGEMDADVGNVCRCSTCSSRFNTYGVSGVYLQFVNLLARSIKTWAATEYPDREINVVTFAYVASAEAPKNGSVHAEDNVVVWLTEATSKPFIYITDASQPAKYSDFISKWGAVCDRFFLWTYHTYFSNTFMYVPTIYHLSDDLTAYKNIGVEYIFMQGAHSSIGDWQAIMKSYVASKLMWDTSLDCATVRNEWINAYFGPGAAKVIECINRMDTFFYENSSLTYYSLDSGWTPDISAWSSSECRAEIALLDAAISAIEGSGLSAEEKAIFKSHVRHVKLSPLGMLVYNNSATNAELKEFYDIYDENGVWNFGINYADNDIYYDGVSTRNVYIGINDTFDITKVSQREAGGTWLLDGNSVNMNDSSLTLSAGKHSLELLYQNQVYGRYSMTITVATENGDVSDYLRFDSSTYKISMEAAIIKAARDKGYNYLMVTLNSANGAWLEVRSEVGGGSWYSGDGKATIIIDLSSLDLSNLSADIWLFRVNQYSATVYSAEFVWYPIHSNINFAHKAYDRTGSAQIFAGTSANCEWVSAYYYKEVLDSKGYDCWNDTDEDAWKAFFKTEARETVCIKGDLVQTAIDNGYEFIEIDYIALAGATELYYYSSPSAIGILSSYFSNLPSEYRKAKFVNGRATITLSLKDIDKTAEWLYLASSDGETLIESLHFVTLSDIKGSAKTAVTNGGEFGAGTASIG